MEDDKSIDILGGMVVKFEDYEKAIDEDYIDFEFIGYK